LPQFWQTKDAERRAMAAIEGRAGPKSTALSLRDKRADNGGRGW
jgi:hypothetical protein